MSGNQNRRSGRPGGRGYSGGKGGAAAQTPAGSSSQQPSINPSRSFGKRGTNNNNNGQGPVVRQNPSSALSDATSGFSPATPPKGAAPNGSQSHFQPSPNETSNNAPPQSSATNNPPKSLAQIVQQRGPPPKVQNPPMPPLPSKGEQSKGPVPVPLQFGTINMGMMNGLPIPARTNSAPPNLDEQKRNQAMLNAMKASSQATPKPQIPQPRSIPTGTNIGTSTANTNTNINTGTNANTNINTGTNASTNINTGTNANTNINTGTNTNTGTVPVQLPRQPKPQPKPQMHAPAPSTPISVPISVAVPVQPQPMPVPYQHQHQHQHQMPVPFQPPPNLQFGAHNPQMQMPLPGGSAPQNPQMFLHAQQQALLHQSQSMGFAGPQPGHQLPPQLGSLGMGPQYPPQQQQQQQGNKYGGARKTTVKITHPDTHEEVRLDNVARGGVGNVVTGHSGQMQGFPHLGYYPVPAVQAGGYNPQMYFGNPGNMPMGGNQMQSSGPQGPRFPYPVTQTGPPINFMQQGGKPIVSAASSHGHNEGGSVEPALASRPTVTITNPAVKVSKPVSETSGKNVQAPAVSKAPLQAPSIPSIQAPSVSPVQGSSVPSVQSVPPVQAPAVPAAQVPAVAPVQAPAVLAVPEEKKKEQPKLELPVPEVPEVTKQAQIVFTKDEEKPNGTNKAPVLAKPEPTAKIEEENPAKTEPKPEKAQQQEEKPVKTEAKAEKTQQEEEKPGKTEAKGEKIHQEKPSKTEAKPEKAQQQKPSNTEEKPEKTQQEVEEKPIITEPEKKNDEAPADKASEKESEKPSLEASKQAEEITEEKKRPNSATSSISTDSESLSSGPSTHMNGNSSKPDTKGVLGAPKDNNKPKDINNSNNNKPVVEVQKRPTSSKKKKKIKEILSKADAAGSSDLYNAYKGPEEKTTEIVEIVEEVKTEALVVNNDNNNNASEEESGANKAELDDWEDVADITTPKSPPKPQVIIPTKKKYTRDFLLTFAHQCTELPQGFNSDPGIDSILTGGGYGGGNRGGFDQTYPSPGRGGRGNDRRLVNLGSFNAGQLDDDRWGKSPGSFTPGRDMGNNYNINNQVPNLMNLRPGSSNYVMKYPRGQGGNNNQFMGGILSPMPAQGGPHRTGSDMDRWQHIPGGSQRGLIPSPVASPHQQMHKAENKYLVGKVSDEEEAKQRRLKGILNKLTPQNFDRLFEQVKEVNIDNPTTLTGVISQIFDKALMEPTFCEMYANFCSQLATALPDFNENNEKITFKRLLLNKCQEEFERGEREEAEAAKEEEGELKQTPEEREEKRIKSRRRMLGNIRLIGELYKKRMLTERIMHECIKKLLGPTQNPDEEDIEALCKLMSTIGEMIDHVKAKEHMDAYFDLMLKLSNNQKYSSRVRFMLKDTMDLRKNRWQQRRKVEGPKKIEDVHRDAANERQAQTTRLSRGGPIMNNPPSMRRTGAGTGLISPQQQGGIIRGMAPSNRMQQDIRYEERGGGGDRYQFDNNSRSQNVNVPLLRREESLTLGPQGGLGRGMSIRGQGQPPILSSGPSGSNGSRLASPDERSGPGLGGWSSRNLERNFSAGSSTSRTVPVHVPVPSPQAVVPPVPAISQSGGAGLPDSVVKEKSISAIREYFSARSEEEVKLCIADMNSPDSHQLIISTWINDSFERKELERDLTYKLLISLCNPKQGLFTQSHLLRGFEGVLSTLEDAVNDAPKAPEYLGQLFAKSITEGLTSLKDIGTIVLQGGEEPGMLIEAGIGGDVIGCVLESVRKVKGEGFLGEVRAKSELNLEEFKPAAPMRSKKLDPFL